MRVPPQNSIWLIKTSDWGGWKELVGYASIRAKYRSIPGQLWLASSGSTLGWHLDWLVAIGTDLRASCGLCPSVGAPISVDVCNWSINAINAITIRVSATSRTFIPWLLACATLCLAHDPHKQVIISKHRSVQSFCHSIPWSRSVHPVWVSFIAWFPVYHSLPRYHSCAWRKYKIAHLFGCPN